MTELIYEELTYRIHGAFFEVYKEKGCGFLEDVYQECLEIKAVKEITDEHRAQIQNYLKATGYKLGLLVNFGHHPQVQIERIAN